MTIWSNFDDMVDDMKEYVSRTGAKILPADDPARLLIGFAAQFENMENEDMKLVMEVMEAEPQVWEIPLTALKQKRRASNSAFVQSIRQPKTP